MSPYLPIALAVLAGLADFVGGWLTVAKPHMTRRTLLYITGVAAGFIVAAAIIDRVPQAMAHPNGPAYILAGFLAIYLVENMFSIHSHDDHADDPDHGHALVSQFQPEECLISKPASMAALLGLLLHTLFDGVAIAAGFMTSAHTGFVMFLAVMFHKFPEGFSVSALMLAAGRGRQFALYAAAGLGVSTVIGAVLATAITANQPQWAHTLLMIATGTFLYIGCSDMIPATNKGQDRMVVGTVLLGVGLFLLSSWLLRVAGLEH